MNNLGDTEYSSAALCQKPSFLLSWTIMANRSRCFTEDDVSVVLLYWIEEELKRRERFDRASVDAAIWDLIQGGEIESALGQRMPGGVEHVACVFSDHEVLASIVDAAVERWLGGSDAPVLHIASRPLSTGDAAVLLGDGIHLGLIFGAEKVYFQDTVHALQTDEICSRREGGRKVNVLGVHTNWRTADGCSAKRCLLVDAGGTVKEMRFETPVSLDLILTLHLPRQHEIELHRAISAQYEQLGLPQLNPYRTSTRADDKACTHRLWSGASPPIASPRMAYVPRGGMIADVLNTMDGCPSVFVQPNKGTEGYKVARYAMSDRDAIAQYISEEIWKEDDALVREERGTLRTCDRSSLEARARGYRGFTLRVNVAWNGTGFVAESGFAQLAEHAHSPVASRGRNGSVRSPHEVLGELYYAERDQWHRYVLASQDMEGIKAAAVQAAWALNAGLDEMDVLKLIGVDLLLEVAPSGKLAPLALEANPRPAGLAQSWLLDAPPKLGVTSALFDGIRGRNRGENICVEEAYA